MGLHEASLNKHIHVPYLGVQYVHILGYIQNHSGYPQTTYSITIGQHFIFQNSDINIWTASWTVLIWVTVVFDIVNSF